MVISLRNIASRVLFALSVNNFNAVFNRVSARLQELSTTNEENPDYADIELIQHISLDLQRLNKLLNGKNRTVRGFWFSGVCVQSPFMKILLFCFRNCSKV
jgi:hypothetical protein